MTPWESRALQTGGETRRTRKNADTHTHGDADRPTNTHARNSLLETSPSVTERAELQGRSHEEEPRLQLLGQRAGRDGGGGEGERGRGRVSFQGFCLF